MNDFLADFAQTLHVFDAGAIAEIVSILSHDLEEIKLAIHAGTLKGTEALEELDACRQMIATAEALVKH